MEGKNRTKALIILAGNLAALAAALWLARRAGAPDRLRYIEPGMGESDEEVDPAALMTDVGESITPGPQ